MKLPDLTSIQYYTLSQLVSGSKSGPELRQRLQEVGEKRSAPAYYQLFSRLVDKKYIRSWTEKVEVVPGRHVNVRYYEIEDLGHRAYVAAYNFAHQYRPTLVPDAGGLARA